MFNARYKQCLSVRTFVFFLFHLIGNLLMSDEIINTEILYFYLWQGETAQNY